MTRQQLTAPVKALLGQLTNNRPGQYFLESAVLVAQYLQGIGSGGNVYSSGEHVIFKTMKDKVGPNRSLCVFDVGANKGQFLSLACSCLDGRQFTIHSFEPGRNTYKQLCEKAGKYTNATLNNFGLGREHGEFELFYDCLGSGLASLTKRDLAHFGMVMDLSEKVKISTIDSYCIDSRIEHIDLLKIDVEGHELDVLNGATQMFRKSAIEMVTFEFGGCNIDTRTFLRDFFHFFHEYQMRIFRIAPSGHLRELQSYKEVFEQFGTTNFLCYRR